MELQYADTVNQSISQSINTFDKINIKLSGYVDNPRIRGIRLYGKYYLKRTETFIKVDH